MDTILSVRDLSVEYSAARGKVKAVRNVSFDLNQGETVAFIGESGCGKTTLALALVRMLPKAAKITSGSVTYNSAEATFDVMKLNQRQLREYRWRDCAMVFQSALNAFNPVLRISSQVQDTAKAHGEKDMKKVEDRILSLFEKVRLDPDRVYNAYPHQLSGGMRQRVLIAMGVLLNPKIVILDEPTTALDVLTQRTIIDVLRNLQQSMGFSIVFISHDLSMAAELAHRIVTMYAGQMVEIGAVNSVFYKPMHPYSLGLLKAAPGLHGSREDLASIPGAPPDLISLPKGCKFQPRCPFATDICLQVDPPLETHDAEQHASACHHWQEPIVARQVYHDAVSSGLRKREGAASGSATGPGSSSGRASGASTGVNPRDK